MTDEHLFARMTHTVRRHKFMTLAAFAVAIVCLLLLAVNVLTEDRRTKLAIAEYKQRQAGEKSGDDATVAVPELEVTAMPPLHLAFTTRSAPLHSVLTQTVWLRVVNDALPRKKWGWESGFIAADGVVVSTAHAFAEADHPVGARVEVLCYEQAREAKVAFADFGRDVMAVSAPDCHGDRLRFERHVPDVNDDTLMVSGYAPMPGGDPEMYLRPTSVIPTAALPARRSGNDRFVNALLAAIERNGYAPLVGLSGEGEHGHSGSPVSLTDSGAVVGMISVIDPSHGRTYMIPAATILDALNEHQILP